ncbi:MAG: DUF3450 family protein, partial [Planctomycetota bacterium]
FSLDHKVGFCPPDRKETSARSAKAGFFTNLSSFTYPVCHRRTFLSLLGGALSLLMPMASQGQAGLTPAAETRGALKAWIEAEQAIVQEQSDWEQEKKTLTELNAIRNKEIEQLTEFVEAGGERIAEIAEKRAGFEAEEKALRQWRQQLGARIAALEKQLVPLIPRFPSPLRIKIEDAASRLEVGEPDRPLQDRTRDVLIVLQAYLTFNDEITVASEMRKIGSEEREVDVLYLGAKQAWFVDRTGSHAGHGRPGENGWTWTNDESLAGEIREAISIQQRSSPPAFVSLPVPNSEEEAQ